MLWCNGGGVKQLAWVGGNCQWQERKPGGGLDLAKLGWGPRGMKDNLEDPKGPMDCPPWGAPTLQPM